VDMPRYFLNVFVSTVSHAVLHPRGTGGRAGNSKIWARSCYRAETGYRADRRCRTATKRRRCSLPACSRMSCHGSMMHWAW